MQNTTTAATIRANIEKRIAHGECVLQIAGIVCETARKMEGKQATKRFHTALKARIIEVMGNNWGVSWESDDWNARVYIWDGSFGDGANPTTPKWNDRCIFTIAHKDVPGLRDPQDTISEAWIVAQNQCYFLEAERLPLLRKALDEGKPEVWGAMLDAAAKLTREATEDATAFGAHYYLSKD